MLRTTLGFMRAAALAIFALPLVSGPGPGAWAQTTEGEQAATPFRPVAVVNGAAITGFDLIQRAQIMLALGFQAPSEEALRGEALNRLIEDWLKMQEADRLGIAISAEELQAGIAALAQQVSMAPDDMLAQFAAQGVSRRAIEDLVAADMVWRNVVRTRFARQIEPGEAEVDAELTQLGQRASVAYRIAEIGLPIDASGSDAEETRALAERLSRELAQGGDFAAAVRRHSRAVSAAQGGEVGWVTSGALPPELAEALAGLEPGDVSRPVEVEGGLSILKVLEKREQPAGAVNPDDPETREQMRNRMAGRRVARLAEGLMQELRRDALIEIR